MRPARKGPENASVSGARRRRLPGFNEAGPQGAGKLESRRFSGIVPPASMRPARKGPENREHPVMRESMY